eukprot:340412-Alexandrium_andersonii.AAC.1
MRSQRTWGAGSCLPSGHRGHGQAACVVVSELLGLAEFLARGGWPSGSLSVLEIWPRKHFGSEVLRSLFCPCRPRVAP